MPGPNSLWISSDMHAVRWPEAGRRSHAVRGAAADLSEWDVDDSVQHRVLCGSGRGSLQADGVWLNRCV